MPPKPAKTGDVLKGLWPVAPTPGTVALLKALHILTRDGALNADSRRKLKQVLHLAQILRSAIEALLAGNDDPVLVDLGAGKSYLGFILYELFFAPAGRGGVVAIERRAELVEGARRLAAECGYERLQFVAGGIADAAVPVSRIDMVTALHACDMATDDAIRFALAHDAKVVALIPCCEAEVAGLLEGTHTALHQLWRHPIQRRAFGAHLTNVMRVLFLESHGYKVRVTEFTGLEHTFKNELILATRHQRSNPLARRELEALIAQIGVRPALLDAIEA